ncbi:MAG: hypothetical protein JWN40_882 [Phycisphaerales bacterium]|nr:hypothetical protein [Phycisphaerales bacterium]
MLDCQWEGEALVVRESLAGQEQAKMSIWATAGMLAISLWLVWSEWNKTPIGMLVFVLGIIAIAVGLVPVVIQQSWRETLLRLVDGTMRLTMGGPLARRRFAWRLDQVQAVRLIGTQMQDGAPVLGEMEILADGTPPIRLFTDHSEPLLARIAEEIQRALRGERAGADDAVAEARIKVFHSRATGDLKP